MFPYSVDRAHFECATIVTEYLEGDEQDSFIACMYTFSNNAKPVQLLKFDEVVGLISSKIESCFSLALTLKVSSLFTAGGADK